MTPTILWFRRDLRLGDHPALLAAAETGPVLPVFVLDEVLLGSAGPVRTAFLHASLSALDANLRRHGPGLVVRTGRPATVLADLVRETGAREVHVSADFGPYGARRDQQVEESLDVPLVRTGSPYAVAPGRLTTGAGQPYRVFTPFHRAWVEHGWRAPADSDPAAVDWVGAPGEEIPAATTGIALPEAGEGPALQRWRDFVGTPYDDIRDRPDLDETSRLSTALRWGAIHPRTLLADLDARNPHDAVFRKELAWREFYASVLHAWPESARDYFRPELKDLPYVTGRELRRRLEAWAAGETGFPIVDAGMRQLLAEGWMHNRVRMIVASFLVKDLQVEWQHGAAHFMAHLVDGDVASNQHNWQWVAGCGTDAAPYFRIFNPITQGEKFDPEGDYIRRWVPELAELPTPAIHRPWRSEPPPGYPEPMVDHAVQRNEALAAYQLIRGQRT
ncbi:MULTISPECIES: cryptochrome/photolyase family protein [unclassified Nocardioides]|uniref:cryptochrome/photolyase family protein n=1 Tax=unclassified Nocardioides TaxID=2615069 RepID=UPI000701B307|nr:MULTISPECIES: deoxyribodipyrimidine photo-lyase [unclassified Nocardioides]KRA37614.1 deoxyribodipyrimidine photolyase [Nocardioides sp. Root614]KRA91575.1 deoxyribodipyrimidine photolyase [Nocardioides sp. Root682]